LKKSAKKVPKPPQLIADANAISARPDSPPGKCEPRAGEKVVDRDRELRLAVSKHLHELQNTLWPVTVRLEMAVDEESCPSSLRETLNQLKCGVDEAMNIAALASALVNLPISEHDPS
jgi:hypothetical protein